MKIPQGFLGLMQHSEEWTEVPVGNTHGSRDIAHSVEVAALPGWNSTDSSLKTQMKERE